MIVKVSLANEINQMARTLFGMAGTLDHLRICSAEIEEIVEELLLLGTESREHKKYSQWVLRVGCSTKGQ